MSGSETARRPSAGLLYVSYDGMLEPLGQSQVIAYLERLTDLARIHVVSFEKPADRRNSKRVDALRSRLAAAGIRWHPMTYHKAPSVPATFFDIASGIVVSLWLVVRHQLHLVHARSYPPALIGLVVKRLLGRRLLFDMRGLWADERTDGGLWPRGGRLYRIVKAIEKRLLLGADHIVTLTQASKTEIESFDYLQDRDHAPISVITTCADLDRFRPDAGSRPAVFTLGYVGSFGTWYMIDEVMIAFRSILARRPGAQLLIVNRNEHDLVRAKCAEHGIAAERCTIRAADHLDVAKEITRMTAGTALIRPVYSKIASAPTKLAEYLGCGVPVLGNSGVGDVAAVLEGERVGIALDRLSPEGIAEGVDRLLALCDEPDIAHRCRGIASRHFALDTGAARYRSIYQQLLPNHDKVAAA